MDLSKVKPLGSNYLKIIDGLTPPTMSSDYSEVREVTVSCLYSCLDEHFKQFGNNSIALVQFYRNDCVPCKQMKPFLKLLKNHFKDIGVFMLNTELEKLPSTFGIISVPTFKLYKGGKLVDTFSGSLPFAELKNKIKNG